MKIVHSLGVGVIFKQIMLEPMFVKRNNNDVLFDIATGFLFSVWVTFHHFSVTPAVNLPSTAVISERSIWYYKAMGCFTKGFLGLGLRTQCRTIAYTQMVSNQDNLQVFVVFVLNTDTVIINWCSQFTLPNFRYQL